MRALTDFLSSELATEEVLDDLITAVKLLNGNLRRMGKRTILNKLLNVDDEPMATRKLLIPSSWVRHMKRPPAELCWLAIGENATVIKAAPKHLLEDRDFIFEAARRSGFVITHLPYDRLDEEIVKAALLKDPHVINSYWMVNLTVAMNMKFKPETRHVNMVSGKTMTTHSVIDVMLNPESLMKLSPFSHDDFMWAAEKVPSSVMTSPGYMVREWQAEIGLRCIRTMPSLIKDVMFPNAEMIIAALESCQDEGQYDCLRSIMAKIIPPKGFTRSTAQHIISILKGMKP